MPARSIAIFDLGGVLIDWNPRYMYRKLFNGNEAAMEEFLASVCTPEWNLRQDAGRPFAEACALLKKTYPQHAGLIDAWPARYGEMLAGPIAGTVEILAELREQGTACYALSNWSAETFPIALQRFDFLRWFKGTLLSGEVKVLKPDAAIFRILFERFDIDPREAVYIDDTKHNVAAAEALGMYGIQFFSPAALRRELQSIGLLPAMNAKK